MSPGGRPPVGPVVNVRLPEELLAALDAAADSAGVNRAEMVRRLVVEGLRARGAHGAQIQGPAGDS